jgi:hypothetical protein
MKFIKAIGVEVEGVWRDLPSDKNWRDPEGRVWSWCSDGCRLKRDGSVDVDTPPLWNNPHEGEIVSKPLAQLEDVLSWLTLHKPDKANHSCGFHIHLSMKKPLYYQMCATTRFWLYFHINLWKWFIEMRDSERIHGGDASCMLERITNRNRFCNTIFKADEQLYMQASGEDPRYCSINYCHSIPTRASRRSTSRRRLSASRPLQAKPRKTFEIRVGHMFNQTNVLLDYTNLVVDLVEGWLAKEIRRGFKLTHKDCAKVVIEPTKAYKKEMVI